MVDRLGWVGQESRQQGQGGTIGGPKVGLLWDEEMSLTQLAHPPVARGGSRQSSVDMQMESRKRGNEREG